MSEDEKQDEVEAHKGHGHAMRNDEGREDENEVEAHKGHGHAMRNDDDSDDVEAHVHRAH
jgi:hypothetical protein